MKRDAITIVGFARMVVQAATLDGLFDTEQEANRRKRVKYDVAIHDEELSAPLLASQPAGGPTSEAEMNNLILQAKGTSCSSYGLHLDRLLMECLS
jgi:hypothetical protein